MRTVALNRPERLNAMNRQLIDDVAAAFDRRQRRRRDPGHHLHRRRPRVLRRRRPQGPRPPGERGRGPRPGPGHPAGHRGHRLRRQARRRRHQRLGGRRRLRVGDQLRLPDLGRERPRLLPRGLAEHLRHRRRDVTAAGPGRPAQGPGDAVPRRALRRGRRCTSWAWPGGSCPTISLLGEAHGGRPPPGRPADTVGTGDEAGTERHGVDRSARRRCAPRPRRRSPGCSTH